MLELGPASEDQIVLAFVQAEIESPRWRPHYLTSLKMRGLDRGLVIDAADLTDAQANQNRKLILSDVRGYGRGQALFERFPRDTAWRRVLVELFDYNGLKCISKDGDWAKLTDGSRLIRDAVSNLNAVPRVRDDVQATVDKIKQGRQLAELILVEDNRDGLVIVEGHTRATAYAFLSHRPFTAFVGTSPAMTQWRHI